MLLDKASLSPVKVAAEKESVHESIKGLHITDTCTVATDGTLLVKVMHNPEKVEEQYPDIGLNAVDKVVLMSVTMPAKDALRLMKEMPVARVPVLNNVVLDVEKTNSGKSIVCGMTDLETKQIKEIGKIEEMYPSFRTITDTFDKPSTGRVSVRIRVEYLAKVLEVIKTCATYSRPGSTVEIHFTPDKHEPIFLTSPEAPRMMSVLMPVKKV